MLGGISGVFHIAQHSLPQQLAQQQIERLGHSNVKRWDIGIHPYVQLAQMALPQRQEVASHILQKAGITLVADAFIANKKALAIRLRLPINTNSHQIIFEAYQEWGIDCLKYLEGMFAFALWDDRKQQLFCAVDPKGARAYCYAFKNGQFTFGSELKCLLAAGLPNAINEQYFIDYIANITGAPQQSPFKEAQWLIGGHALLINAHGVKKWCYWSPQKPGIPPAPKKDQYYEEATERLIFQLMKEYLGDLPQLGMLLHGNAGSAYLLSILKQQFPHKPITAVSYLFPKGYQGELSDDREYIELLQRSFDFSLKEVYETALLPSFDESIETKFHGHDLPIANPIGSDHNYIYPAFHEANIHEITSNLFYNPLQWHAPELPRNLWLQGNFKKLWNVFKSSKATSHKKWHQLFLDTVLFPSITKQQYHWYNQIRNKTITHNWGGLKEEIISQYELVARKETLASKGEHPHLLHQKDFLHYFQQQRLCLHKPFSHIERRHDITSLNFFQDRRLTDWLLQIPLIQFVDTPNRPSLWKRLVARQKNIPAAIIQRVTHTPWPADMRARRQHCKAYLWDEYQKIPTNSPLWDWVDQSAVDQLYHEVQMNGQYTHYRKHYSQLIKYPLIHRYLIWQTNNN